MLSINDVTAVIPARNEDHTVADIIAECLAVVSHVVVIDGHSTDKTAAKAKAAGAEVYLDGGKGKGDGIRTAAGVVKTDIVVFIDADGSHVAADIPKLVQPIIDGNADHVTASRLIGGSSELHGGFDEFFRLAGSAFITACINKRFGVRLSDSQNGFRSVRTKVLRDLDLKENSTTIEQEMVMKTLKKGYRMAEVPSHEYCRRAGTSSISIWRSGPRYVYTLIKYLLI